MWDIIKAAGWPIWPLIFVSVVALALIIERAWTLRRAQIIPPGLVDKVIAEYKKKGLTQELVDLTAGQGPMGQILAAGLANIKSPRPVVMLSGARARDGVVAIATGRDSALRRVLEASGIDAAFTLYDRRSRALDDLDLPDPGPAR